jgi:diguanylate cyclase (GGDEF)-like protein/PAS domain S-box-containing protein
MHSPLKILVVEDLPSDFLLLQRNLKQHGLAAESRLVGSDAQLEDALQSAWDVVLADYNVPGMDFLVTLHRIQKCRADLPVILVSSSVGEEKAVELLKLGLSDFILKENPARLPTAILRALEDNKQRQARQRAEDQLRQLSLVVEQSPESIAITNIAAEIEYVNEAFVKNTGYSRAEAIGQNPRILHSDKTPKSTYVALWKHLTEGQTWQGEFYNKRKDGSEYIEHAIISPLRQPDGRITHYVAIKEDITKKKRAEALIHHMAFYDSLTGLPNRALLLERMGQTLALTRRDKHHSALVLFNIDRFKNINDTGGQLLGDALLVALGERVAGLLREGDVLARVSGDEFAILLPDLVPSQHNAAYQSMRVVEKIQTCLRLPFSLGEDNFTVSACLGIALFPENEKDTPLDILRRGNTALHHAKEIGTGQIAFFEGELDDVSKQRFNIERELRQGIESGELRLYLQPQVDAAGKILGAEALVRWQHPVRGLLPPSTFITIAEETDLIVEIGEWVFAEVCRLLVQNDVQRPMRIAVNISPRHFRQPDFVSWIKRVLNGSGTDASQITLEITEGMVINNISDVIAKMTKLSALGIHFSMDDFGTGYSSLAYLKRLPINELKIDKSFIQDVTTDPDDAALVEAILAVAKLLHLSVVAEGVETAEQASFLNQRATVIHQGYLFGKPEPAERFFERLTRQQPP